MKRRPLMHGLALLLLALSATTAAAEEIAIPLASGNQALADFHPGATDKPAVLILHGFLQTYQFSTIRLIFEELADNGYTVIAPTLTLNIDRRRQSLTCDAIQNHTVIDTNREIGEWVAWLTQQGYRDVVMIGHSSGSLRLLSYLSQEEAMLPRLFIATSIGPIGDWKQPQQVVAQIQQAKQRLQSSPSQISNYTLGFCHANYTAPPKAYLSYMQWSEEWVLEQLKTLPIPLRVVLGSNDSWLPPYWHEKVAQAGLPLTTIEEASHNFTGPTEFEFQEAILQLLERLQ